MDCIETYKDRIRIPSHVDREYHRHLFEVPAQVLAVAENKKESFSFSLIEKPLREHFEKSGTGCQFPSDQLEKYLSYFKESFDRTAKEINELVGYYKDNFESHDMQTRISNLLGGLILPDFTADEIADIKKEGKTRYERKIPPGYMDSPKASETDDNNQYGDLIVWKEILRLAEREKKHIFFICRDVKEDWIAKTAGKTLGPRIELIVEFKQKAPDCIFHIYTLTQFLEYFGKNFSPKEPDSFPKDSGLSFTFDETSSPKASAVRQKPFQFGVKAVENDAYVSLEDIIETDDYDRDGFIKMSN